MKVIVNIFYVVKLSLHGVFYVSSMFVVAAGRPIGVIYITEVGKVTVARKPLFLHGN
jgi:hypothetical protein